MKKKMEITPKQARQLLRLMAIVRHALNNESFLNSLVADGWDYDELQELKAELEKNR